jgi:hypothetical protein
MITRSERKRREQITAPTSTHKWLETDDIDRRRALESKSRTKAAGRAGSLIRRAMTHPDQPVVTEFHHDRPRGTRKHGAYAAANIRRLFRQPDSYMDLQDEQSAIVTGRRRNSFKHALPVEVDALMQNQVVHKGKRVVWVPGVKNNHIRHRRELVTLSAAALLLVYGVHHVDSSHSSSSTSSANSSAPESQASPAPTEVTPTSIIKQPKQATTPTTEKQPVTYADFAPVPAGEVSLTESPLTFKFASNGVTYGVECMALVQEHFLAKEGLESAAGDDTYGAIGRAQAQPNAHFVPTDLSTTTPYEQAVVAIIDGHEQAFSDPSYQLVNAKGGSVYVPNDCVEQTLTTK